MFPPGGKKLIQSSLSRSTVVTFIIFDRQSKNVDKKFKILSPMLTIYTARLQRIGGKQEEELIECNLDWISANAVEFALDYDLEKQH